MTTVQISVKRFDKVLEFYSVSTLQWCDFREEIQNHYEAISVPKIQHVVITNSTLNTFANPNGPCL